MSIPEKALNLLTRSGFYEEYYRNLGAAKTNEEAYKKTEELYMRHFTKPRYSSFHSFQQTLYRWLKNQRKK